MKNIQALREKIANLARLANHLLAEKGDQTWTAEEQKQFDGWADEIALVKNQIAALERMRNLDADEFFKDSTSKGDGKKVDDGTISVRDAVALYLRNGSNVTPEQAGSLHELIREAPSGTTFVLAPGTYMIADPLRLEEAA